MAVLGMSWVGWDVVCGTASLMSLHPHLPVCASNAAELELLSFFFFLFQGFLMLSCLNQVFP